MLVHCVVKNPAEGGGRWVEVPPERLMSWIVTFAQRHHGVDGTLPVSCDSAIRIRLTEAKSDGPVPD